MDQLKNFADSRLLVGCVYCGGNDGTREHVPSKVFLDSPLPKNLSVIGACRTCNNGFSIDEEYVACLIEAAAAGSIDPGAMRRPSIAKILERSPSLRTKLEMARTATPMGVSFKPESKRVERVFVKLAMGHAAFELAQECRGEPLLVWWRPIQALSPEQREEFDAPEVVGLIGEVGSRGTQRLQVMELTLQALTGESIKQQLILNDWVDVQADRYRYLASHQDGVVSIRMVIGEYLAAEVTWKV